MNCKNCNAQLIDGSSFCPFCGAEFSDDEIIKPKKVEVQAFTRKNPNEIKVAKVWKVLSKLSKIFGIVSLALCWIPILGFIMLDFSIPGLVFGVISGRGQANDTVARDRKKGIVLCILSITLTIICYVIFLVIVALITRKNLQQANNLYSPYY